MQFVQAVVLNALKDHGNDRSARKAIALIPVVLVLVLVAGAAHGAPFTTILNAQATCDGVTTTEYIAAGCELGDSSANAMLTLGGSFEGEGGFLAYAAADVAVTTPFTETSSSSATIQDDVLLMVTGGLAQGYYSTCVLAGAGGIEGGGQAFGMFGNVGARTNGEVGDVRECAPAAPFTAGVGQLLPINLFASGFAYSSTVSAEGGALVLASVDFFDSSMNPAPNVAFLLIPLDIEDLGIPEPASQWLVVSGLLMMAFLRGRRRGQPTGTRMRMILMETPHYRHYAQQGNRPVRKALRFIPVALVLLADTVHGAPVTASLSTEANCGGVLTMGLTYAACGVGRFRRRRLRLISWG